MLLDHNISSYNLSEEEEKKLILREYRGLLRALKYRLKRGDKKLIRRAFEIAADAHKSMRRKSGEPYILHPIAVAKIVVEEIGLGLRSAICALLHDTVEDTEVTLEEIRSEFGNEIARIIDGLTKISNVVETANTSQQAENFRKILLTLADDPRTIIIKIADRLHNMRTLDFMKKEKQLKIASETTFIYAPIAHRLGFYEIKSELEDLSLKYLEPEVYEEINSKLAATKKERARYINDFIRPIKQELEEMGFNFEIYGRPKAISSILNKIRTKHVSFEEVYDLFAIRIILDTPIDKEKEECWKVYSVVTNHYQPSQERLRDWISQSKGNGYEALHTTVMNNGRWVEIQIRTKRMNDIAEKGIVAHWKYKEGGTQTSESKLEDWLKHVRDLLKNLDSNSLEFIQDMKQELFNDEMYIYTPKGDMRILPLGSTALDFAFDIHSELGAKCIGAKVNHKLVPISHKLKNGDQIEIITSSKQKPHEDWLKFVITGKAKSRIKYYLREKRREIAEQGKIIFDKKLKSLNFNNTQQAQNEITAFYKQPSPQDLFYEIAIEKIDLKDLKDFKQGPDKLEAPKPQQPAEKPFTVDELLNKKSNSSSDELIIFGEKSDRIQYKLASCCQPLPGDDVFGFVTSGDGLKIHRVNCTNAQSLLANYGHRVVKAKWAKNKEISFLTALRINGLDDVGVISKITNIISGEMKINMRSMSLESKDGLFEGNFTVFVQNKDQLDELCNKLESLEGINQVTRLEAE